MNLDYERIERAIHFIEAHVKSQPGLEEIASFIGLSPFHFQRLFRRWAGVSPKRFMEYLTVKYAKQYLNDSKSILDVSYEVGLSSPGRLHDHFVSIDAMTPGEYKRQGAGMRIFFGVHDSPFGNMLIAMTNRGICRLAFVSGESMNQEINALHLSWPHAEIVRDENFTLNTSEKIFGNSHGSGNKIRLMVRGTNFQVNVWKALLKIPFGCITSYQQVARLIGRPNASRAVGTANASNPVAFLIPCHRVLRNSGDFGLYHWGLERKRAMVAWEAAKSKSKYTKPEMPTLANAPKLSNKNN